MNNSTAHDQRINPRWLPTQMIWDVKNGVVAGIVDPADVTDYEARVLSARNLTAMTGTCPECGAKLVQPNRRRRRAAVKAGIHLAVRVEHEDGCVAVDPDVPQWHRHMDDVVIVDGAR